MSGKPAPPLLCPSVPAKPGAMLIGLVGATKQVANLGSAIPVDENFIALARSAGIPEQRFRFSAPCVELSCTHWTGHSCGLINVAREQAHHAGLLAETLAVPPCGIRPKCRWWLQDGPSACAACKFVVFDPGSSGDH